MSDVYSSLWYSYGRMKVICFANEKGGVAKTTSCVNLAICLAMRDKNVLVFDLDPQSNATLSIGFDPTDEEIRSSEILEDPNFPLNEAIVKTETPGLDVVRSNAQLANCNKSLVPQIGRETFLRNKMCDYARVPSNKRYDFVLIDCCPALDLLTVNALMASTDMIIPVQPRYFAYQGMALVGETVTALYRQLDAEVKLLGILVTLYDKMTVLDRVMLELLKEKVEKEYGDYIFHTVIGKNITVSEADTANQPIVLLDPNAPASQAYNQVADELLQRVGES